MGKRCLTVLAAMALMAAMPRTLGSKEASSGSSPGVVIGYVDLDRVAAKSEMVKKRVSSVEEDLLARQKEYRAKAEELRTLRSQLTQQETILTPTQKEQLASRIRKLRDEMEYLQFQADKILSDTSRDIIEPVLDQVLMAVERVAKAYKVDIVLRGDLVLFASERVDLTDQVIRELDRILREAAKDTSPAAGPTRRSAPPPDAKKPTPDARPSAPDAPGKP